MNAESVEVSRIAQVLAWRAPADPCGSLERASRSLLLNRIEAVFSRNAPPGSGAAFRVRVAALPLESRRRLLSAPALWGAVLQDFAADLDLFLDALRAEELRIGIGTVGAEPLWTALGDGYFPGDFRADHLLQGAVLDASSPFATARVPHVVERFEAYDSGELALVLTRVQAAGRALPGLCAEASALVAGFARTVLLRRDPDHTGRWMSESTEGFLGRIILVNAHLPSVGPLDLVEALVHESVHAYVSTVELFHPLIPDRDAAAELLVTSPWTGNTLDAQRFVHAALVWFALGHLWARAQETERADRDGISGRFEATQVGFRGDGLAEALTLLNPFLSPTARALLGGLARTAPLG